MVHSTLVVVLSEIPVVILEEGGFSVPYTTQGRVFRDAGLGKVVGHYDWLHNADGNLIGLRTEPFDRAGLGGVLERLARHPAVQASDNFFSIFLTSSREIDEERSLDYEFGINWVLVSDDGTLALTYDASLRTDEDLATIRQWVRA